MIITKLRNIIIYVPTDSFQGHESLLCNMIKCYRIMSVLFPASPIQQLEHQSETYAPPHFQYPCDGESVGGYGKKTIFADGRTIGASAAGNAEYLLK